MTPLRIGLVGAGTWAGLSTAPMIAAGAATELSAVYARRQDAAASIAARHGGFVARTFEELLASCDAVAFAVPPDVQADLAPRAAAAGRHLLLEKPLAGSVGAAEAVAVAAAEAGVVTQMVLTNRYTQPVRDFLRELSQEVVRGASAHLISGAALPGSPFATPWRDRNSALLDLGPHVLDLLDAIAGPIRAVSAVREPSGCLALTLRHSRGAISTALLSSTTPGTRGPLRCEVLTDSGLLVLPDPSSHPRADLQRTIADEFAAAVADRSPHALDAVHGLRLQRLLDAVERSAASGALVSVDTASPGHPLVEGDR